MARFIECRTSQGVVYQVNVDQITYLLYNAALGTNTREFISWGLISRLASKRPHKKLWRRLTRGLLHLGHPTLEMRVGTSRLCQNSR
jgi:hypothetical protein